MLLAELWHGVGRLAVFGDSITVGVGASTPELAWASLVARALGGELLNAGISGTVLQVSPDASGQPRPGNGTSRLSQALLGPDRAGAVCILYGYNDARYMAAPDTMNVAGFTRDYRRCMNLLLSGGLSPDRICIGSPPYIPDAGFSIGSAGFTGQSRAGFEVFVAATRQVAVEYGSLYAPVYEAMAAQPDGSLASFDTTHPNDLGHELIAATVLRGACPEP